MNGWQGRRGGFPGDAGRHALRQWCGHLLTRGRKARSCKRLFKMARQRVVARRSGLQVNDTLHQRQVTGDLLEQRPGAPCAVAPILSHFAGRTKAFGPQRRACACGADCRSPCNEITPGIIVDRFSRPFLSAGCREPARRLTHPRCSGYLAGSNVVEHCRLFAMSPCRKAAESGGSEATWLCSIGRATG